MASVKHHVYYLESHMRQERRESGRERSVLWTLSTMFTLTFSAQELCESRGGRPGLPVPNSPYGLCGRKATFELESATELRICVKVEVAVLGSSFLIVLTLTVDV